MRDHLEHLFGGFLDGCQDGLIEITYCDDESGRPKKAKHFGTDEMDEAAAFAFEQNPKKNVNIYVGAALRRPDILSINSGCGRRKTLPWCLRGRCPVTHEFESTARCRYP